MFQVCFLATSQLLLGQIEKVRSVLKSVESEDFKTVLTFDQVETEIIVVKDTRGHFQFLQKYARFLPVLAVMITFFVLSKLHLTFCNTFCDIFHTNDPAFNKINTKEIDF